MSTRNSQKFASVKKTLVLWANSCLEDLEMETLALLALNIRTAVVQETNVIQLRYDAVSNVSVVSIPQFREVDFLNSDFLEGNLRLSFASPTFSIAAWTNKPFQRSYSH